MGIIAYSYNFKLNNLYHALDNNEAIKFRKKIAKEFKEQLTIGNPTNEDEKTLKEN